MLLLALMPALVRAQVADSVTVSWTAPGDDGDQGTAATYDLRVSEQPITDTNFANAFVVPQVPPPDASGTVQRVVVRNLLRDRTYYFAIRTADNQGNWSTLSNLVRWDWNPDAAPPAAPRGLHVARDAGNIRISWDPNTEPDLAGYNVYRVLPSGGSTRLNTSLVLTSEYLDTAAPETGTVTYEVTAVDMRGNESARSRSGLSSSTASENGWELKPGYPNPSRIGEDVHIPVVVPITTSTSAVLQILDSGGRPVRRISVDSVQPGLDEIMWDGRNDAGRMTAPGVYRGWLIAGDARVSVRLLRAP